MKRTLLTTVATVFVAGAAFAGSPVPVPAGPTLTPPMPTVTDWSGFYVGALGGMQDGDLIVTPPPTLGAEATNYGAFAGYNFQNGNFVYGAEVAGQMGTATYAGVAYDIDYLVDARARIGYAFDSVMVYAAGGYTTGQVAVPGPDLNLSGWNAGAGVEISATDNIFFGAEYIYRDLTDTIGGTDYESKTHGGQVRIGYRF